MKLKDTNNLINDLQSDDFRFGDVEGLKLDTLQDIFCVLADISKSLAILTDIIGMDRNPEAYMALWKGDKDGKGKGL